MYTVLATNAVEIKEQGIAGKDGEISVAVVTGEIGQAYPTLYAFRQGQIYNPYDSFKPNINGNHKLPDKLISEYHRLLPQARAALENIKNNMNAGGNGGGGNSELIEGLKNNIAQKEARIREQAEKIAELSANQNTNNGHGLNLEQLIERNIKAMEQMKPREIIIRVNDNETTIKNQVLHEEFETVLTYIAGGEAVYMAGPAGTGKSHIAKQVADALELDFYPTQALSQEHKITGYMDANGIYHDTSFRRAFEHGGLYMIDEIDASHPDILVAINTALANGYFDFEDKTVTAHDDFRVIAAGNTVGTGADMQYTGRYAIDASTLDRFFLVEINYSRDIEMSISGGNIELVEFAQKVREAAENSGITILFSYRSISRIAKFTGKIELPKLLNQALLKGIAADDVRILARNMNIDRNNKYFRALNQAA